MNFGIGQIQHEERVAVPDFSAGIRQPVTGTVRRHAAICGNMVEPDIVKDDGRKFQQPLLVLSELAALYIQLEPEYGRRKGGAEIPLQRLEACSMHGKGDIGNLQLRGFVFINLPGRA